MLFLLHIIQHDWLLNISGFSGYKVEGILEYVIFWNSIGCFSRNFSLRIESKSLDRLARVIDFSENTERATILDLHDSYGSDIAFLLISMSRRTRTS